MSRDLTLKRRRFVTEYLIDGNGTRAAIAAGYSKRSAGSIAEEMLRKPEIAALLAEKAATMLGKLDISVERVLRERARLAFFDPRKLLDDNGEPLGLHEVDDDTAAAIAGLDTATEQHDEGPATRVRKYKLADKNASLTALEKHLGMYADNDKGSGVLNIQINFLR